MLKPEFFAELASSNPAPGGGAVAALAGQLGGGLLVMVQQLSRPEDCLKAEELKKQAYEMEALISEDTQAFNQVMDAFRLPKATEEEKIKRKAAIQAAYKTATLAPLKTAEKSLALLYRAHDLLDICNKNCASDLGVAVVLLRSAVEGGLMNMEINLPAIKDDEFVEQISRKIHRIKDECENLLHDITDRMKELELIALPKL